VVGGGAARQGATGGALTADRDAVTVLNIPCQGNMEETWKSLGEVRPASCTVLYCTVCKVLYCTVLYCTVLYYTVLYCTVLYFTVCVPLLSYDQAIFEYLRIDLNAAECGAWWHFFVQLKTDTVLYCTVCHCVTVSLYGQAICEDLCIDMHGCFGVDCSSVWCLVSFSCAAQNTLYFTVCHCVTVSQIDRPSARTCASTCTATLEWTAAPCGAWCPSRGSAWAAASRATGELRSVKSVADRPLLRLANRFNCVVHLGPKGDEDPPHDHPETLRQEMGHSFEQGMYPEESRQEMGRFSERDGRGGAQSWGSRVEGQRVGGGRSRGVGSRQAGQGDQGQGREGGGGDAGGGAAGVPGPRHPPPVAGEGAGGRGESDAGLPWVPGAQRPSGGGRYHQHPVIPHAPRLQLRQALPEVGTALYYEGTVLYRALLYSKVFYRRRLVEEEDVIDILSSLMRLACSCTKLCLRWVMHTPRAQLLSALRLPSFAAHKKVARYCTARSDSSSFTLN